MLIKDIKYRKVEYIGFADKIDYSNLHSEMTQEERYFVNGIIREIKPQTLLEVGVASGGGTVNLLNAISDDENSRLISVDCMNFYYRDSTLPVGIDVIRTFGNIPTWKLYTGKDVSEILGTLDLKFDFAIIDTLHSHPVEALNFLCVLPFLNDGAIVVLHDISLCYYKASGKHLATRVLMSALAGEKLFPKYKSSQYISPNECVHNICAIQITKELKRNIHNIFYTLEIPWEVYPIEYISNVRDLLSRYYGNDELSYFDDADKANFTWYFSNKSSHSFEKLKKSILKILSENKKIVFYGAGKNMNLLLRIFEIAKINFDCPIWDINANRISQIRGKKVLVPLFEVPDTETTVIITLGNMIDRTHVSGRLKDLGYKCIDMPGGDVSNISTPIEFSEKERKIVEYILLNKLSMVSPERMFATISACKYAVENNIPGDFVECGVWRGGNALAAAMVFKNLGSDKKVWLFDTFQGFTGIPFQKIDKDVNNYIKVVEHTQNKYYNTAICGNSLNDVRRNFDVAGVLSDRIVFVQGDVEKTLDSDKLPDSICVLRLDTDWYISTMKELRVLFPKISLHGVLMVDDYGHCTGARAAVDEYFNDKDKPLLQYIDYTGRLAIKVK